MLRLLLLPVVLLEGYLLFIVALGPRPRLLVFCLSDRDPLAEFS